jgi:hypothetical protein
MNWEIFAGVAVIAAFIVFAFVILSRKKND